MAVAESEVSSERMRSSAPIWFLASLCPDCGQGSSLVFVACPRCGHLALPCDEATSPAYPEPRDLAHRVAPSTPCPGCGSVPIEKFVMADSDAIEAAGFRAGEYTT